VHRLILAAVSPDNTPHGYNLTFAIPMVLFAVIAAVLYLLFSRPHRRIPATPIIWRARTAQTTASEPAASAPASTADGQVTHEAAPEDTE